MTTYAKQLRPRRRLRTSLVLCGIIGLACGTQARGTLLNLSGSGIEGFLTNTFFVRMPGSGSQGFVEPSTQDLAAWRTVVSTLLQGSYQLAANLADPLGYDIVRYHDNGRNNDYYVLLEKKNIANQPLRGLGTFAFNPRGKRLLNIQSPHPLVDTSTWAESADLFAELDASFWQVAGTNRCANSQASDCDGTSGTCGTPGADYRISDVAHFTENFYQHASTTVANFAPDLVSVSVHGFTPNCNCNNPPPGCPNSSNATSMVVISNLTSSDFDNSLATRLAAAYNNVLDTFNLSSSIMLAGSCNAPAGNPLEVVWPHCGPQFCGGTNVQGRAINDSPDACVTGVSDSLDPERFLHVEQQSSLRQPPTSPTASGLSWQVTIDAFAQLFRRDLWLDYGHAGTVSGSFFEPYRTLASAVTAASNNATIHVLPGRSTEATLLTKPIILRGAPGGTVSGQ